MDRGKYIIVDAGLDVRPILFPCTINHSDFLKMFSKEYIVSAGFFEVGAKPTKEDDRDISVCCWGKSVTLGITSREEDSALIKKVLRKTFKW